VRNDAHLCPYDTEGRPARAPRVARCIAILAIVCSMVAGARPAAAQVVPPEGGPAVQSWALTPSGEDPTQPGARTDLTYELAPGATIQDSVTVFNYGNVQLTLRVYSTDAFNTATGAFELLAGDTPPTDVGTWVTLPQPNITLPPKSSITLPITITVPQNAPPGDHAGAILAASRIGGDDGQGHEVAIDRRTGTRLYIRVAGPLNPALVVEKVKASYSGGGLVPTAGSVKLTYTVRNAGNVRLAGHQKINVQGLKLLNIKSQDPDDLPELLPGNALTLTAQLDGVGAALRLDVDMSVTPFTASGAVESASSRYTATAHVWAIPWSLVVLLLLIVAAWRRVRRGRIDGTGLLLHSGTRVDQEPVSV
jgi:hypothetical protein